MHAAAIMCGDTARRATQINRRFNTQLRHFNIAYVACPIALGIIEIIQRPIVTARYDAHWCHILGDVIQVHP